MHARALKEREKEINSPKDPFWFGENFLKSRFFSCRWEEKSRRGKKWVREKKKRFIADGERITFLSGANQEKCQQTGNVAYSVKNTTLFLVLFQNGSIEFSNFISYLRLNLDSYFFISIQFSTFVSKFPYFYVNLKLTFYYSGYLIYFRSNLIYFPLNYLFGFEFYLFSF